MVGGGKLHTGSARSALLRTWPENTCVAAVCKISKLPKELIRNITKLTSKDRGSKEDINHKTNNSEGMSIPRNDLATTTKETVDTFSDFNPECPGLLEHITVTADEALETLEWVAEASPLCSCRRIYEIPKILRTSSIINLMTNRACLCPA